MKLCISSIGKKLTDTVDPRFGRCAYFLIGDSEGEDFKAIKNPGVGFARGAGISAAQVVASEKVEAVITGNIGPNAFVVLNQAGIKIYAGAFGMTGKDALLKFKKGKLKEATEATGPGFVGRGGMGPGGGTGRKGGAGRGAGRGGGRWQQQQE